MSRKITALLLAGILALSMPTQAMANKLTEAKDKQQDLKQELSKIKTEKAEIKNALASNKQKREEIIKSLEEMGFQKQAVQEKLDQIDSAIQTLTEAIAQSEKEYNEELALFQERILVMYQRSKSWQGLDFALDSTNISEFYKNRNAMKTISKADQDMMASLQAKLAEIDGLKKQKEEEERITQGDLVKYLEEITKLQTSRSQVDEQIQSTSKTLAQLEAEEDEINAEAAKISSYIKQLSTTTVKYVGGDMNWPAPGNYKISSAYGYRIHPIFKTRRFHSGIDIHANKGESITAANGGTVIYAGVRTGYGNTVILDHGGGITTLYAHIMNRGILVKVGQTVKSGAVIAKVGSTGWSTGPHLHFEYRKNGDTQNPVPHFGTKK